ncbi:MAG: class I SAM-dependent methyltransferase [archaeon]
MKTYYDYIADGYENLHREEQMKKLRIIKKNLEVRKDDLMLDVGCGPGFSSEVFNCRIIGLDPSEELLKKCSFRIVVASAEEIPFLDDYFDVVISVTAIHNFDDYRKGILEMKRVGRNKFVFSVLKKSQKFEKINLFIEENFKVSKKIEEEKDVIFFSTKKP